MCAELRTHQAPDRPDIPQHFHFQQLDPTPARLQRRPTRLIKPSSSLLYLCSLATSQPALLFDLILNIVLLRNIMPPLSDITDQDI